MSATRHVEPGEAAGWLLIRNPAAGSAERELVEAVANRLGRAAEAVETEDVESLEAALLSADGRDVVVCGGDGSLHVAVWRARALGLLDALTFGVVPLGTGNDFATSQRLPTEPAAIAAALREGSARRLDLLVDDRGGVVVNAVHVGIGVDAAERSAQLKDGLGKLAYPLGAAIAGVAADGLQVHTTVDGRVVGEAEPVLMVVVANGPTIGGGHEVLPDAAPDDGAVDVAVIAAVGPAARAAFAVDLLRGTHLDRDDVHVARGQQVTLSGSDLAHNADGELMPDKGPRVAYTVAPAAWTLRGPRRTATG